MTGFRTSIAVLALLGSLGVSESSAQKKRPPAQPPTAKFSRTAFMGIWWSPEMPQVAAFDFRDSTVYYPDQFIERRYRVKGDTLFVEFEDGFVAPSIILKLTADTLVLFSWDHEQIYTRREPAEAPR